MSETSMVSEQIDAMREYIAGDAHAEMQTVIGLLRYYSEGGRDVDGAMAIRLADRLSRCCARGREVIGALRPEERCS